MISAQKYMHEKLKEDRKSMIGKQNEIFIDNVSKAWMDDNNDAHRFLIIKKYFPEAKKILDMAAGCGTFVFYGLLNGYDVEGIEPEDWKREFNQMKVREKQYPEQWSNNIINGYGENLPYPDNYFDVSSTYQTLEHVNSVEKCLEELVRVTKNNGGIHIVCPDYRGTFEGHYLLPWMPLMPRSIAKKYLKLLGRKTDFFETLNYTTTKKIKTLLKEISKKTNTNLLIIDINRMNFESKLKEKNLHQLTMLYPLYKVSIYLYKLFRADIQTNLLIIKNKES